MTRSAESLGIEMRRLSVLLLLLVLALVGCSSRFQTSDGGYLDGETGRTYKPLTEAFEAITGGEEIGVWESKVYEDILTFRTIPDADPDRFLTDDKGNVYCADDLPPDAATWRVQEIYVCRQGAVDVALNTVSDAAVIAQIRTLWHEGQPAEDGLPYGGLLESRVLKMASEDCPGIYYCVLYFIYEDGSAYFYDRFENRAVLVSEELMKKIPIA